MHGFLKQSTASQSKMVGPFIDDTDFKTVETGLTIANTDVKLSKNGAAGVNKNSGGGTHRNNGMYSLTFNATDTDTVGEMEGSILVAGALVAVFKFTILEEAIYDSLFANGAAGFDANQRVNIGQWLGQAVTLSTGNKPDVNIDEISDDSTAPANLELMYDGTGYPGGTAKLGVNLVQIVGVAQSATDLKDFADTGYDPITNKVQGVVLVDTTTTNTDMVGTDNAALASVATEARLAELDAANIPTDLSDIKGATFDTATDSLEAIRDRGDSAWTTGAGGSDRLLMVDTTIATLATQTSFTLTAGSTDNDAYNNLTLVVEDVSTSTQKASGMVLAYVGSTKTITLKEALAFTIATTDKVYILAENSLKSTVANRQLDVTTTGATGVDWGNVENKNTANDLSATDIQLSDTTTTLTNKTGFSLAATGLDAIVSTATGMVEIAKSVWDRILSGATHNITDSSGKKLRQIVNPIIRQGLAQGSGTGTNQIQLDTGASSTDGMYDPSLIVIIEGTGSGQSRLIYQYEGATRTATLDRDWKTLPDSTSEFQLIAHPGREHVNEGLAQAATSTTITLNTLASSDDDAYNGQIIFIRSGTGADQVKAITDYDGTTKIAAINDGVWAVTPDTTSGYVMLPSHVHSNIEIGSAVWDLTRTGHSTSGTFGESVGNLPQDIETRLPSALVGGRMDSNMSAINNVNQSAINLESSASVIIKGTVDTGSVASTTTTFESDDITEATADHYNGRIVIFISGALTGQATDITDYSLNGSNGSFTVTALTEAPLNNVKFIIV